MSSVRGPVYNLTTTMAKLLAVGLPLRTVVASVTSQPAEMLGRSDELGSLAVGRVADITVLRLAEREWTATDSPGERRVVRQQFEPVHTIRAGAVIQPRPPEGP